MPDELAERLQSHARSFDSLLSLIPAKLYYGEDVSDQWQRKKQTPEQKRAAKMAKLDPDNWKSAKDVLDERAAADLKRKRDAGEDEDIAADIGIEPELPHALQEDAQAPKSKKRKVDGQTADAVPEETEEERRQRKAQNKAARRERKQEKKAKAKQKQERQKAKKRESEPAKSPGESATKKVTKELHLKTPITLAAPTLQPQTDDVDDASTATPEEEELEEVFSPQHESGISSSSSIQPASIDEAVESPKPDQPTPPGIDASKTPRERLQATLSQMRAERKADGADGRPPKNRQELLEQRRRKEEQRKATKKEQKRREKEEEARRQDEEIARRFSPGGSGSLLASPRSPMIGGGDQPEFSPQSPPSATHDGDGDDDNLFSFGRIAFGDGTSFDPTASTSVVDPHNKKGPRAHDTAATLKLAQAKQQRLAGLDTQKRAEIEEKDMWLNAKRRAHGDRVKDDTNLLKRALKRQQGQKRKSEREWGDRVQGVQRAQEMRQKKRTENLAKRKEEKGSHGKSSKGAAGKAKSKVKRPGFEGSFKGRTGGGKKKA